MQAKKRILIIGYDSNLCLGVLYCLRKEDYEIFLVTSNRKNAARFSRFVKKIRYYEKQDELLAVIIDTVKASKIDLVMPIDEMEIKFANEHQDQIKAHAALSWTTPADKFSIGINKLLLAEFLTKNQIPCPRFATADTLEALLSAADEIGYPVLIKPARGSFGRSIMKFTAREEIAEFYKDHFDTDFILQRFLVGSDITCNVICRNGEIICHTIQESPVKYGSDFSSNDILEFHEDAQVIDAVGRMMKLLSWNGVACVDIRRDKEDGNIYILEINGRFWASVVVSWLKAGVNFPLIMVRLALGLHVDVPAAKPSRQITMKQYLDSFFSGKNSFKDTKYISYVSDPVARLAQILRY